MIRGVDMVDGTERVEGLVNRSKCGTTRRVENVDGAEGVCVCVCVCLLLLPMSLPSVMTAHALTLC